MIWVQCTGEGDLIFFSNLYYLIYFVALPLSLSFNFCVDTAHLTSQGLHTLCGYIMHHILYMHQAKIHRSEKYLCPSDLWVCSFQGYGTSELNKPKICFLLKIFFFFKGRENQSAENYT